MRKRSPSCRPLSPASLPTRPRASRPRPAASLLDKLTVEEMPASSRRYPFVGLHAGARGRQGHPVCDGRLEDRRRREAAGQGFVYRQPRRQDRFRRRERARANGHASRSSWASWSPTRARSNGAFPRRRATSPRTTASISTAARRDACRLAAPVSPPKKDDVYLRGFLGPDALLRRGGVQVLCTVLSGGEKGPLHAVWRMMLSGANVVLLDRADQPPGHGVPSRPSTRASSHFPAKWSCWPATTTRCCSPWRTASLNSTRTARSATASGRMTTNIWSIRRR